AELQAVTGELRLPRLAVLARREIALLDGALLRIAAFPFQEQLHALAAAQAADRSNVTSHSVPFRKQLVSWSMGKLVTAFTNLPTYQFPNYTRRLFGGRHPLCGIGVTSRIDFTSRPTVCSARIADSRPDPGPLTH